VKIVVGLGNPGRDYERTRHNLGFMVVDELGLRLTAGNKRSRFRATMTEAHVDGEKLVLVKPQTFMNLSGTSVREAVSWYKVRLENLLVVADDIDLPFGTIRLRAGGSSGGHNGLKSIFTALDSEQISRLKIGIGRGQGAATRQVLTRFSPEEERLLPYLVQAAADCVLDWNGNGITSAMNRCNRKLPGSPEARNPEPAVASGMVSSIDTEPRQREATLMQLPHTGA